VGGVKIAFVQLTSIQRITPSFLVHTVVISGDRERQTSLASWKVEFFLGENLI
jgi:hypothetical protein